MCKFRIFLVLVSWFCSISYGYDFYVSPNGSDLNPGSKNKPVYSLTRAYERAHKLIELRGYPKDGIAVWIAGGQYSFEKTLTVDPCFSGTEDKPIVFKSFGGKAIFNGGQIIDISSAKLVKDAAVLDRFNPAGKGNIYSLKIDDAKLKLMLAKDNAKLSYDGQMMNLAKYPNIGYGHIDKIIESGAIYASGRTIGDVPKYSMENPIGGVFSVLDKDISAWESEFATIQKAKVTGYLSNDWYKESHKIASIEDEKIKLLEYSRYGVVNKEKIPRRIIVSNLLCELDSEGEFYFDERNSELFFWPFGGNAENGKLSVWAGISFADLKGVRNIRFENIIIEGVSQGPAVIKIENCENVELAGCTVRNCSIPAVLISGGKHCGIRSCDIYDVPHHLTLEGGNVRKLLPSGHYAINNHFTQVQAADFYGKIQIKGVGQVFQNNLVHNFIGQVMTVGDNDHLIEYNEFFNIGIEEGDGGTIYSGAQMWSYGNVYKHNFLHHLICIPQAHPRGGIYPDDHDAGDTIMENIFYKAAHRTILLNGGAGHTVASNIFLDGYIGIYNTSAYAEKAYEIIEKYESGELKRGDKMDHIWRSEQVVGKKGWNNEPWISKYPKFAKVMNQEKMRFWPIECIVKDNLFSGNIYDTQLRTGWGEDDFMDMSKSELIAISGNKQLKNRDIFKNPDALDFSFKNAEDNEQIADIQFDKIGLYKDQYRISMPDKDNYRQAIRAKFRDRKSYDPNAKYDPSKINASIYFNTGKLLMQGE